MVRKEIFIEETILDGASSNFGFVDVPLSNKSLIAFFMVAVLFTFVIFIKISVMDITKGEVYSKIALANSGVEEIEQAPRGIIYDRFGNPLVKNIPTFYAYIKLVEILKNSKNVEKEISDISKILNINKEDILNKINSANLEKESSILLLDDISINDVAKLRSLNKKWLVVSKIFKRKYIYGKEFAHILGYTGIASLNDLEKNKNLSFNDKIGKEGLEAFYDDKLRGKKGVSVIFKNSKGKEMDKKIEKISKTGDNLFTSIDLGLQKYFYNVFIEQLKILGKSSGAGIILNPRTGEILSMLSFPSYDDNDLNSKIFLDKNKPTFNRPVSGLYSPGSTIKPLVGVAALNEGIIIPSKKIFSPGYIKVPNPYNPKHLSVFLDWRPQGWVDIYSAIARSSNVYFYEVGGGFENQEGLGITKLKKYWKKFELDEKTGVDLLGESSGLLPDPEWKKKKTGDIWRLGDTYNISIGQGDLMITPIELIRYISSIPNRGKLPHLFLVGKIKDNNNKNIFVRKVLFKDVGVNNKNLFSIVEKGMIDGVKKNYGTSYILHNIPMKIAAKTGSSQFANNTKTNAFFVGYNIPDHYNPIDDIINVDHGKLNYIPKQIAVLILIEDAKEGSLNAVPIAKKVFEWYYENRIKNTNIKYDKE